MTGYRATKTKENGSGGSEKLFLTYPYFARFDYGEPTILKPNPENRLDQLCEPMNDRTYADFYNYLDENERSKLCYTEVRPQKIQFYSSHIPNPLTVNYDLRHPDDTSYNYTDGIKPKYQCIYRVYKQKASNTWYYDFQDWVDASFNFNFYEKENEEEQPANNMAVQTYKRPGIWQGHKVKGASSPIYDFNLSAEPGNDLYSLAKHDKRNTDYIFYSLTTINPFNDSVLSVIDALIDKKPRFAPIFHFNNSFVRNNNYEYLYVKGFVFPVYKLHREERLDDNPQIL